MTINMNILAVYDGDLRTVLAKPVTCVPRVGEYVITPHGRHPVHSVTYDYSGETTAVEVVIVVDA